MPFYTRRAERVRKSAIKFGEWLSGKDLQIEDAGEIPPDVLAELWERGYYTYLVPVEYGGEGGNLFELSLILEALSPKSSSVSLSILIQALCIILLGLENNESKKKKRFLEMVNERRLLAFAISDAYDQDFESYADEVEGGYQISGRKAYVNQAMEADWLLVLLKFKKKLGILLTKKGTEGIIFIKEISRKTARGLSFGEVLFNNARASAENLIGKPGEGEILAEKALCRSAVLVCAMALGLIEEGMKILKKGGFRLLVRASERESISRRMAVEVDAGRALCYQAGYCLDHNLPGGERMAIASKIFLTELCYSFYSKILELAGPDAIRVDFPLSRFFEYAIMLRALLGANSFLMENLT